MVQTHEKRPPRATANSPPILTDMGGDCFINLRSKKDRFLKSLSNYKQLPF